MKNLFSVLLFIGIVSCQPVESTKDVDDELYTIVDTAPALYAVPVALAEKNIAYYDKLSKEALGIDPVRAFTIRSVDVAEAIGLPIGKLKGAKYHHLRIYMGLDSLKGEFKIYLTPVDSANLSRGKAGKDVILDGPFDGDAYGLDENDGPYVLDFSKPCPSACDDGSPLNE